MKVAGLFSFWQLMDPATIEAPATPEVSAAPVSDPHIAALEAQLPKETVARLDAAIARQIGEPETETPPPADAAAHDATSESTDTSAPAKPSTPATNDPVLPPASWRMDDEAMQVARRLGLPDEVVRDFRSESDFNRAVRRKLLEQGQAPPAATQQPPPETPKSKLDQFLADEQGIVDPELKDAIAELRQQMVEKTQVLTQFQQWQQQQQQQAMQAHQQAVVQEFDKELEALGDDFLGKARKDISPEHFERRKKLFDVLTRLADAGLVSEVSRASVEAAYRHAFPEQFQEQLSRRIKQDAAENAQNRIPSGRTSSASKGKVFDDPADDPELKSIWKQAREGTLSR